MKYLYKMDWAALQQLVQFDLFLDGWTIFNEGIQYRMDRVKDAYSYQGSLMEARYNSIVAQADRNVIGYNENEIVTWFDTLTVMYHVFQQMEDEALRDHIVILQEYCIPYSNKRADYVLCYDNKILIIEFSFRKLGYELQYETKLHQAIGYKELIGNILPKEIDIGTYTYLVDPGLISDSPKVYDLAAYIEKFFNKNIDLAIKTLTLLDDGNEEEEPGQDQGE